MNDLKPASCTLPESRSALATPFVVRGFSLIEIMVGLTIGLIGIMVMLQVYTNSEAQKRTTAGGDDAQNAGAIGLYGIQRDIQQSGWGFATTHVLGCDVVVPASASRASGTVTLSGLAPVTINHASITGQDANTDTLLIVYGSSNGGEEGDIVAAAQAVNNQYYMSSPFEFPEGARVLAQLSARPSPCSLTLDTVTQSMASGNPIAGQNESVIQVQTGRANMLNGTVYTLGPTPHAVAYAVRGGQLTQCRYIDIDPATGVDSGNNCGDPTKNNDATVWVPVTADIVSLKAQYGRDTNSSPMDGIVDMYDTTTPTTACGWAKISAIRVALVARNSQALQNGVTTAAPVWLGSSTVASNPPVAATAANPIVLSGNANWQSYRYKLFQTAVPIRNVIMKGVQTGC